MSGTAVDDEDGNMMMFCAGCGKAEGDGITLKRCNGCYLVRYCGTDCQKKHRSKHRKECKKRAAELHDEILFKQPEGSHHGDCPICCLPLPLDPDNSFMMTCCAKLICNGCNYANQEREFEQRLEEKCPYCRLPAAHTEEEQLRYVMKRIEANDPVAMTEMGTVCLKRGDNRNAFKYLSKAAALGNAQAQYSLSIMYRSGMGVEMNEKKCLYHSEQAAIGGHPIARYNLGSKEKSNGKIDRAVKHWIIGATLGGDESVDAVKNCFKDGLVSKEDFTTTLRAYQTAIEATKSPKREEAVQNTQMLKEAEKILEWTYRGG